MAITCTPITDDVTLAAVRARIDAAFGAVFTPAETPDELASQAIGDATRIPELSLALHQDGEPIGGTFAMAMDYTLPGGQMLPIAGLSGVGVEPSAAGRGAFRPLITTHLSIAKKRGYPASTLFASEAGLYGRFGYGRVSTVARYEATSAYSQLDGKRALSGTTRLLFDADQIRADVAAAHDTTIGRSAMSSRSPELWNLFFDKKQSWLGGGKRFFAVHYDDDGAPTGYVAYTVVHDQVGHDVTGSRLEVNEFVAGDVDAELSLWRYLTSVPLTRRIVLHHAPTELALTEHLRDPRQLRQVSRTDAVWLRPLDVERLLTTRRYEQDGRAAFDFDDPQFEDLNGTYTIDVVDGVAQVAGRRIRWRHAQPRPARNHSVRRAAVDVARQGRHRCGSRAGTSIGRSALCHQRNAVLIDSFLRRFADLGAPVNQTRHRGICDG
ncbi:MAG: GNAT family N-acetyltransferase [Acidimicrobiales bacterium]